MPGSVSQPGVRCHRCAYRVTPSPLRDPFSRRWQALHGCPKIFDSAERERGVFGYPTEFHLDPANLDPCHAPGSLLIFREIRRPLEHNASARQFAVCMKVFQSFLSFDRGEINWRLKATSLEKLGSGKRAEVKEWWVDLKDRTSKDRFF